MFNCFDNHVCSHCMQSLDDNRVETIGDVQISDMLSNIFFIPWREFINQSNEGNKTDPDKTLSSDIETSKTENEIISIPICYRCESVFVELYKAYTNYEALANPKSLIRHARDFVHLKVQIDQTKLIDLKCEDDIPFDDFQFNDEKIDSDVEEELESKHDPLQSQNTDLPRTRSQQRNLVIKLEKMTEETVTGYQPASKIPSRQKKKKKISSEKKTKVDCERNVYKCKYCDKTFGSRKPLTAHKKTHQEYLLLKTEKAQEGPFPCDICGKMFATLKLLNKHRERHDTTRSVKCEVCGKMFRCNEYYKLHFRRAHGPEEEREQMKSACTICGKLVFNMNSHMLAVHGNKTKEKFDCNQCEKFFPTLEKLELHFKAHESTTSFKCLICGREFPIQEYLAEHHEKHHSVEKPHACHLCPKRFHLSKDLRYHMETHTTEKPYVCEHCGTPFKNIKYLKRHLKNHADEGMDPEAFKCNECGKKFKNGISLAAHKGRFHRTDLVISKKIHECSICGKRLYDDLNLRKHEALHYKKSAM